MENVKIRKGKSKATDKSVSQLLQNSFVIFLFFHALPLIDHLKLKKLKALAKSKQDGSKFFISCM